MNVQKMDNRGLVPTIIRANSRRACLPADLELPGRCVAKDEMALGKIPLTAVSDPDCSYEIPAEEDNTYERAMANAVVVVWEGKILPGEIHVPTLQHRPVRGLDENFDPLTEPVIKEVCAELTPARPVPTQEIWIGPSWA
jgi:hypothetical protein